MGKTSAKQLAWSKEYIEKTYDRVTLRVPKGKLEEYKKIAASKGMSLTAYINKLLETDASDLNEKDSLKYN